VRAVLARLTRRGVLATAAVAAASCGGGDPPPRSGPRPGSGVGLLNSILAFEHAVVAAYSASAELLRGQALAHARTIAEQEREHVRRVSELVEALGGTPARARHPDEYDRAFPRLRGASDALRFAEDLEERLVRAYLDSLHKLPDRGLRRTAAAIGANEAEHLAVVQALRGEPLPPQAFVTGT
jgi:rubrerythrin